MFGYSLLYVAVGSGKIIFSLWSFSSELLETEDSKLFYLCCSFGKGSCKASPSFRGRQKSDGSSALGTGPPEGTIIYRCANSESSEYSKFCWCWNPFFGEFKGIGSVLKLICFRFSGESGLCRPDNCYRIPVGLL
jgi:hypothetical protein